MTDKQPTLAQREKFIEDLELTFQAALEGKNLPAAVKAKELQAKELGFFGIEATKKLSLKDLKPQDLQDLLAEIESHPFKHVHNLDDIKKEIKEIQKVLEERDRLQEKVAISQENRDVES
ncbi:MAG TPA: hypothetical protein DD412_01700 [Holosporales bacterium]|nr:hypothetical protein [Holosporales bacterium]